MNCQQPDLAYEEDDEAAIATGFQANDQIFNLSDKDEISQDLAIIQNT